MDGSGLGSEGVDVCDVVGELLDVVELSMGVSFCGCGVFISSVIGVTSMNFVDVARQRRLAHVRFLAMRTFESRRVDG
jgi:hypothetical protein